MKDVTLKRGGRVRRPLSNNFFFIFFFKKKTEAGGRGGGIKGCAGVEHEEGEHEEGEHEEGQRKMPKGQEGGGGEEGRRDVEEGLGGLGSETVCCWYCKVTAGKGSLTTSGSRANGS
jgi:hypothetical protein